jgi:hypothetical protein
MDTHPPTLTADDLVARCADADLTVTKTQLGRWASAGLLPPPVPRGKAGERGVDWVWEEECLPRALIVARALEDDRSLEHAAMELWVRGYPPLAPALTRQLLHNVVAGFEERMARRQAYLKRADLPVGERRRRFVDAARRRLRGVPVDLRNFGAWTGQGLLGLANPGADKLSAATSAVAFPRLHALIDAVDDQGLRRAADTALAGLARLDMWLTPLLQTAFERGRVHGRRQPTPGVAPQHEAAQDIDILWFTPLATLALLAWRSEGRRALAPVVRLLADVAATILGKRPATLWGEFQQQVRETGEPARGGEGDEAQAREAPEGLAREAPGPAPDETPGEPT